MLLATLWSEWQLTEISNKEKIKTTNEIGPHNSKEERNKCATSGDKKIRKKLETVWNNSHSEV